MHNWTNSKGPRSQGSQDFYLEKIFSVIGSTNKYFVEFGFNKPSYTVDGSSANTWNLYENGWRGLLLDGDTENPLINLKKRFLFSNNIASILMENMVPKNLDYLSCDMDSHDLWVFKAILDAGYRPRVITTEYNGNYPIADTLTLIDPTMLGDGMRLANFTFKFQQCAWGASAGALRLVAEAHGYTLIGRVGVLDLIWMQTDLLYENCHDTPPFEWFFRDALIGVLYHAPQSSVDVLSLIVDYKTYIDTEGDLNISNKVARSVLKDRKLPCFAAVQHLM